MADLKGYAGYVDTEYLKLAAELAQQDKQRTYTAMRVQPGFQVLDVGCGPGFDTLSLAQMVGESGRAVGVDHDPAMIAEALTAGAITEAELARWRASLEQIAAKNAFFATLNHNLVAGRKP